MDVRIYIKGEDHYHEFDFTHFESDDPETIAKRFVLWGEHHNAEQYDEDYVDVCLVNLETKDKVFVKVYVEHINRFEGFCHEGEPFDIPENG